MADKVAGQSVPNLECFSFGPREYAFLEKVPEYFTCVVCQGVLKECLTTECCLNSFCKVCLDKAKERNTSCPMCRKESVNATKDKKTDRLVGQLKVLCRFWKKGCSWNGELSDVEAHIIDSCLEATVKCPLACGAEVERRNLEDHKTNICVKRETTCECGHKAPLDRLRTDHLDEEGHCPLESLACRFKYFGCSDEVKRCEMEEHELSCMSHHLKLVKKRYRCDVPPLIEKVGHLEEELKALQSQLSKLPAPNTAIASSDKKKDEQVVGKQGKAPIKSRSSFQSNQEYGEYVSHLVKRGTMVRLLEAYESVQEGDIGVFMQSNALKPPAQVKWLLYGQPYWVFWHQLEIVSLS